MSAVAFHRSNVKGHSEVRVNGSRYSVDKIAGSYFVAKDGQYFGVFDFYSEVVDAVNADVVNDQNAVQDKVIESGKGSPCFDLSCIYARGPVCTCSCGAAGHSIGYSEVKF
jgi:hypothetical protein